MKRVIHYEGKFKRFVSLDEWEFVERVNCWGVVAILALTDDRKVVLVEQHRVPVRKNVIEFPAGLVDGANGSAGETLQEAAKRELLEETGYVAKKMIFCTKGPISSASSSDVMTIFRAEGLRKVSKGGGDAVESITVHEVPIEKIDRWLEQKQKEGKLIDSRVYAGLYLLNATGRRPKGRC